MAFDAAVIKPAEMPTPGIGGGKMMFRMGPQGGPGTADPGQITYSMMNLHQLITTAFGVKSYQVNGPASIDTERYDITAKIPHGASKDDVQIMLQNLLKDRFALKYHREKKDMGIYAIVAAKNGPKLTESADQSDPNAAPPPTAAADGGGPNAAPPPPPGPTFTNGPIKRGPDGMPILPSRPGLSTMMMMTPTGARMKMVGKQATLAQLADSLSNQLDKPAANMTGLDKRYDFTLDFAPDTSAMANKPGNLMLGGGGGGGGAASISLSTNGPGGGDHGMPDGPRAATPEESAVTLFTALQSQLGLKLESRKAPMDIITVDSASKTPTEN
jgi:uncharacterized protein (TIGR03435 family)